MKECSDIFKMLNNIDPNNMYKLIIQKTLVIYKYYKLNNSGLKTPDILIKFLDEE